MLGLSSKWTAWRYAKFFSVFLPAFILLIFLFTWHLGSSPSGTSLRETEAIKDSRGIHAILSNPINAPHKIVQLVFRHVGLDRIFWMRFSSVLFALLFIVSFYLLVRKWFGNFVSALATLLFVSIPWVIILGRSASSDIMLLSPILLIAAYTWLKSTKEHIHLAWCTLIIAVAITLYVPGAIWFILLSIVVGRKPFREALSKIPNIWLASGIGLLILLFVPLAIGIYRDTSVGKSLLLIPSGWPAATETLKSAVWSVSTLAYKTREHVDFSIGRLPILNIAQSILAIVGLYAMSRSARREVYGLITLLLIGIAAATVNENAVLLTLCLPSAMVFAAAGLRYISMKWLKVFPLNPLPRAFAYVVICLLVLANLAYGVRYSLAAWPHNMETRKTYVLK